MVIDIILIALLALGLFFGYKKGVIGILIGVAALILSLVLAFMLQGPVANYLYTTPIGTSIESNVSKLVSDTINSEEKDEQKTVKEEDFFNKVIQEASKTEDVVKEASKNFTLFILKGITFIGIFILVRIICYILQMILNVVFDLPILNSVNKFGGVALSLVTTLIKLWILLAIIQLVSSVIAIDSVTTVINQSYLTKILYENNILLNMLQSGIKL